MMFEVPEQHVAAVHFLSHLSFFFINTDSRSESIYRYALFIGCYSPGAVDGNPNSTKAD
jgi:hypothetical protein